MKKVFSLLLACVLTLALLCACGGKDAAEQTPAPEATVTVAYAQAIVDQLIAHDALPKDSKVLAISKDGNALSLDMDEAFLAGLRQSGSTGESMYLGSLVNTFLDNFNCETVRVTVEGKTFSTAHADYDKPLQAFTF